MQEITAEMDVAMDADPRKMCLLDFNEWAKEFSKRGDKLVVLADANQSLDDSTKAYNLQDLAQERVLISTMDTKHKGKSLKSLDQGSRTIDHILNHKVDEIEIRRAGQLSFRLGFYTNHRGDFADLDGDSIL